MKITVPCEIKIDNTNKIYTNTHIDNISVKLAILVALTNEK